MIRTCTIVLLAAGVGGCVDNANQRLLIGDDVTLASLPPEVVEPTINEDGMAVAPEPPADDAPTATGLDRSNFEPVTYRVPIDGTRHEFHGFDELSLTSETARQRGEYPTALTALETGGTSSSRDQAFEILLQPAFVAVDAGYHGIGLLWPEWLAAHFVSGTVSSPEGYERAPAPSDPAGPGVLYGTTPADDMQDEPADTAESAAG